MSVAFDTVTAGEDLLDVHSTTAGNTTMRVQGVWRVRVISVDSATRSAMCSWNGNPATRYTERSFAKLRRVAPEWLRQSVMRGRTCHYCHAEERDGHRADCKHPKAVRARAKASGAPVVMAPPRTGRAK